MIGRNNGCKECTEPNIDPNEHDNVVNLSSYVLRDAESRLLELGLKYVPTVGVVDSERLVRDFGDLWERYINSYGSLLPANCKKVVDSVCNDISKSLRNTRICTP